MSKITFDILNKYIIVNSGVTTIDVKTELYEEWQNWSLSGSTDSVFRIVGGDFLGVNQTMPIYYFLINYWRIYVEDLDVSFATNLYSDDFVNPIIIVNSVVYVKNSDTPNLPTMVDDLTTVRDTLTGVTSDLRLILGLVQHNFSFSRQTYNASQDLTSGIINLYGSADDTASNIDSIASYKITATYNKIGLLTDYNVCTQEHLLADNGGSLFADENGDIFRLE